MYIKTVPEIWCGHGWLLRVSHKSILTSPFIGSLVHDQCWVEWLLIIMTMEVLTMTYMVVWGNRFFAVEVGSMQEQEMAVPWFLFRSLPFPAIVMQNASLICRMTTLLACSITHVCSHIWWCCSVIEQAKRWTSYKTRRHSALRWLKRKASE